jgi:hypothetical protein
VISNLARSVTGDGVSSPAGRESDAAKSCDSVENQEMAGPDPELREIRQSGTANANRLTLASYMAIV